MEALADSDGRDGVTIYVEDIKAIKKLPPNRAVNADKELILRMQQLLGSGNVKVV